MALKNVSGPSEHYFVCNDGTVISVMLMCDRKTNCQHGEDEKECDMSNNLMSLSQLCYINGKHLAACEYFVCDHMHYKCSKSYCIPRHYLCDGTWHCPEGGDENVKTCSWSTCPGQFICNNSAICLFLASVCNDIAECPLGDDEHLCFQEIPPCPKECQCLSYTVFCANLSSLELFGNTKMTNFLRHVVQPNRYKVVLKMYKSKKDLPPRA